MEVHQRGVARKVKISGVNTKVGIGNSGTRHVQGDNDLLKVRGRMIRGDVIGENDEESSEGRKAKCTAYLTKEINESHDQ